MNKTIGMKILSLWGVCAIMAGLLFFALPASAATLPAIVPDCARNQGKEAPSLNCALQTFGNIAQLILGITGSFALLMFVYGGFTLMSSAGSSEKVSKGKTIITNAIIGIIIIFGSGLLIQYGMSKLELQVVTIGGTCNEGKGVGVQLKTGKIMCASQCSDIGFACIPPSQTPPSTDCISVPGCQGICCPGAAPKK